MKSESKQGIIGAILGILFAFSPIIVSFIIHCLAH
jgi:hypothetical protein